MEMSAAYKMRDLLMIELVELWKASFLLLLIYNLIASVLFLFQIYFYDFIYLEWIS